MDCVFPCVCLSNALWKNNVLDPDVNWDGRLDEAGGGDRSVGRGNFGRKYGAPHCNQWGLFTIGNAHCAAARLLLAKFLELQARRTGEVCRLRRSNAALLPRDRGQTCYRYSDQVLNLFLALLLSSFGAESLKHSQEDSEPNKLQEAVDRINRLVIYIRSKVMQLIIERYRRRHGGTSLVFVPMNLSCLAVDLI